MTTVFREAPEQGKEPKARACEQRVATMLASRRRPLAANHAAQSGAGQTRPPEEFAKTAPLRVPFDEPKKEHHRVGWCSFFGAPPGTRTLDPLIKSQLLYQLS